MLTCGRFANAHIGAEEEEAGLEEAALSDGNHAGGAQ